MPIKVICVGKNKQEIVKQTAADYLMRIRRFCDIDLVTIPDVQLTKSITPQLVIDKESAKLIGFIQNKAGKNEGYTVLLDKNGKTYDSLGFSRLINRKNLALNFIVGGVYGVNEALKKAVDLTISLSALTFTHQMSRIILLEQIYRSMTILNNKKYHY